MPDALDKLRPKHKAFVLAYLDTLNATEAARRAKYEHPMQQGSRLLRNVEVAAAIEEGLARYMGPNEVLQRTTEFARGTMEDFITIEEIEYREQVPVPAFKAREQIRSAIADAYDQLDLAKNPTDAAAWQKVINDLEAKLEELPDNPAELITIDGPVKRQVLARIDLEKARAAGKMHLLKKVKQTERGLEVELYSAADAQDLLGKHHKLWTDRIALEGTDGPPLKVIVGLDAEEI
jgi:phage terminase small subunit